VEGYWGRPDFDGYIRTGYSTTSKKALSHYRMVVVPGPIQQEQAGTLGILQLEKYFLKNHCGKPY